jgi:phosphoglycolate phosphatase-like HAD superfamily hydrolase
MAKFDFNMDFQESLKNLRPHHDFFIGIDSDGCVFDTMEIKQKKFFVPNALKYFDLYPIADVLSETWEFVNLYSIHRGGNRFTSIIKVFDLLKERKEIKSGNIKLPDLSSLKKWIKIETRLSNANLRRYFESDNTPGLENIVNWTEAVNKDITTKLGLIPPFTYAKQAIELMSANADLIIISQTPLEALEREWEENDLKKYVRIIAGQEHGTKTEHIALASKNKYPANKILMIGDAKGDRDAAVKNGILFFPIIPGKENESWELFIKEGYEEFINGRFKGNYEQMLLAEFEKSLPSIPPWH